MASSKYITWWLAEAALADLCGRTHIVPSIEGTVGMNEGQMVFFEGGPDNGKTIEVVPFEETTTMQIGYHDGVGVYERDHQRDDGAWVFKFVRMDAYENAQVIHE